MPLKTVSAVAERVLERDGSGAAAATAAALKEGGKRTVQNEGSKLAAARAEIAALKAEITAMRLAARK